MTNLNLSNIDPELFKKMGTFAAHKVAKPTIPQANPAQPAPTFVNTTMLIEDLDKRCEDGTYHWHDFIADNAITNDSAYKPLRDHIQKKYGGTRDTINGVILWIGSYGSLPRSIVDQVRQIIEASNVTFNFQQVPSGTFHGSKIYKIDQLQTLIYGHFRSFDLKPSISEISAALAAYLTEIPHNMIEYRAKELAYDPSIDPSVWNAVGDVFDPTKQSTDFAIAILKKFIWQVKRKMRGITVTDHLMPVVFSSQGSGKSWWLTKHLYAPVIDMTITDQTFKKLTEDRNASQWDFLIHHFDEMAYADASDIETVKECITSDTKSYRPMGTNVTASIRNMATMIGCSNKADLSELIRDETGIRRFAPLYFSRTKWDQRPEWKVDPVLLWKTVNENGPDPVAGAHLETLQHLQKTQKFLSPFEMWLEFFEAENDASEVKTGYNTLWISCDGWLSSTRTYASKRYNANAFYKFLDQVLPEREGWKVSKPQNKKTAHFTPAKVRSTVPHVSQVVPFETDAQRLARIVATAKSKAGK